MIRPQLNYLELPVRSTAAKRFYESVFGWMFQDFGPTYSATTDLAANIGLQADETEKTVAPLPVIQVEDIVAFRDKVAAQGGTITQDIFSFPGGQRFHFTDLDGHELAVWQEAAHSQA